MRRLFPLALLAACAGGSTEPSPPAEGRTPIDVALGPDRLAVRTDQGTIEWAGEGAPPRRVGATDPSTASTPVAIAFPVDFPIPQYPGSAVVLQATESDPPGRAVFLVTPDAAAAVVAFYEDVLPGAATARVESPTGPATTLSLAAADGRRAVTVGPHATGTSIALSFESVAP